MFVTQSILAPPKSTPVALLGEPAACGASPARAVWRETPAYPSLAPLKKGDSERFFAPLKKGGGWGDLLQILVLLATLQTSSTES